MNGTTRQTTPTQANSASARSKRITRLALRLFDSTKHLHGLTRTARPTVEATAAPAPGLNAIVAQRIAAIIDIADALTRTLPADVDAEIRFADDGSSIRIALPRALARSTTADSAMNKACDAWNAVMRRPILVTRAAPPLPFYKIRSRDSVARALQRVLQHQLEEFLSRVYGLPDRQDIEFVHEMRVASRRLRAAFRVFKNALDGQGAQIARELGQLGAALGAVRDLDMFLKFLREYKTIAPPDDHPAIDRVTSAHLARRRRAHAHMLALFEIETILRFEDSYYQAVRAPLDSPTGLVTRQKGARSTAQYAPKRLRRALDRVLAFHKPLRKSSSEEQHAVRKQCRELRYKAEFLEPVYSEGLVAVIQPMSEMKDLLGFVHDTDVYSERIRATLQRMRSPLRRAEDSPALERILEHLAAQRMNYIEKAIVVWKTFRKDGNIRRIRKTLKRPRKN